MRVYPPCRKRLIAIARRRPVARERGDAISKARCRGANKTRVLPAAVIHRGEYLARARSESKTRVAHRRTNASPGSLFAACARVRVLVWPTKISRIFLLGINPDRNTGQRVRAENSLDKQPSRPPSALSPRR